MTIALFWIVIAAGSVLAVASLVTTVTSGDFMEANKRWTMAMFAPWDIEDDKRDAVAVCNKNPFAWLWMCVPIIGVVFVNAILLDEKNRRLRRAKR